MIYKIKREIYTIMKSVQKVTITTVQAMRVWPHTAFAARWGKRPKPLEHRRFTGDGCASLRTLSVVIFLLFTFIFLISENHFLNNFFASRLKIIREYCTIIAYKEAPMNAVKELRSATKMSQSRFATYLGIPVANIQNWEQGVNNPPNYVVSLISRVMKNDGYIEDTLSPAQVDSIRQVQATLAIEALSVDEKSLSVMKKIAHGDMTYDEAIADLKRRYKENEKQ